ncbi:Tafazzin [Dirofilaria immitis]|nr:Tafazzin [Dirofilaria immitis]
MGTSCGFQLQWPFPKNPNAMYRLASKATLIAVLSACKLIFSLSMNRISVINKNRFLSALENKSRPLITVSNHRSNMDDPLIWCKRPRRSRFRIMFFAMDIVLSVDKLLSTKSKMTAITSTTSNSCLFTWREFFSNISRFRYTLAAHDICFTKAWHTLFFSLGKCVPIVRGDGVYQKGVDFCIEKLAENQWIHIFPEGKVTPIPVRIKWGVARMIMESPDPPIVLPIWIHRMAEVWPQSKPYYPRMRKHVTIMIGAEVDMKEHIWRFRTGSELEKRKALADFVQEKLFDLGKQASNNYVHPKLILCSCVCVSVFVTEFEELQKWIMAPPSSRKQSIVEAAEKTFDKNTLILIVNLLILVVLTSLLYMVATSAMASSRRDEH